MVYLQMLTGDVLDHADIHELIHRIWPEPFATSAEAATLEDGWLDSKGQIFLIRDLLHQVVGITGYFDIQGDTAYLRWTGVLPELRRQYIFTQAMRLLVLQLKGANPNVKRLIELVPDTDYGKAVAAAFSAIGFVAHTNIPVPEGEDDTWDVIPYVLNFSEME